MCRACTKTPHQRLQALTPPPFFPDQLQCSTRGSGNRRGWRRCIDIGTRLLDQGFNQVLAAGNKRTEGTECLAECTHQYRHLFQAESGLRHCAAAFRPDHTQAMCIINQQPGCMPACNLRQLRQRCNIPVHAEYAIGRNQVLTPRRRMHACVQVVHIAMLVTDQACTTQARAIQ